MHCVFVGFEMKLFLRVNAPEDVGDHQERDSFVAGFRGRRGVLL